MLRRNKFTRAQVLSLKLLWQRLTNPSHSNPSHQSYLSFRRTAYYSHTMGCVMVPWCGMMIGIETDGHTHS